jgi:methionyl aminopeptidase
MLRLKNEADIRGIWASGQIAGAFLDAVGEKIRPGVSTLQLDELAGSFFAERGAESAFLNYRGFPGNICVSLNDEIVHGIPSATRIISAGDVVSVDVGVRLSGYISDTARTFWCGSAEPPADIARLLTGTRQSLSAGIGALVPGQPLRRVSQAIEKELAGSGLGIFAELTGHGVGFAVHEEPTVYNVDLGGRTRVLEGMVIAIEPMASLGSDEILLARDKWTYLTVDGSLAAHFEHTVAVWEGRAWVLTDAGDKDSRDRFGVAARAGVSGK